MERLTEQLKKAGVVGFDTPVFIYHLESHPEYAPLTHIAFSGMEAGKWEGVTSTITLMEVNVQPWQLGKEDVARQYEILLVNFPNLTILDVDPQIASVAAQLRARFGVRPPNAIQVAASIFFGAKAFLTNDKRLAKLQEVIDVIVLDDFLD